MTFKPFAAIAIFAFATPLLAQQAPLGESHLNALDGDGDGAISKTEFDEFTNYAFDAMDTNNDGALSPDEVDDHVVGDAFKMLDDDGDGSVSSSEFSSQMQDDFAAADKDGDGILN